MKSLKGEANESRFFLKEPLLCWGSEDWVQHSSCLLAPATCRVYILEFCEVLPDIEWVRHEPWQMLQHVLKRAGGNCEAFCGLPFRSGFSAYLSLLRAKTQPEELAVLQLGRPTLPFRLCEHFFNIFLCFVCASSLQEWGMRSECAEASGEPKAASRVFPHGSRMPGYLYIQNKDEQSAWLALLYWVALYEGKAFLFQAPHFIASAARFDPGVAEQGLLGCEGFGQCLHFRLSITVGALPPLGKETPFMTYLFHPFSMRNWRELWPGSDFAMARRCQSFPLPRQCCCLFDSVKHIQKWQMSYLCKPLYKCWNMPKALVLCFWMCSSGSRSHG